MNRRRLRRVLDRRNPLYAGRGGRAAGSRPIENRADSNPANSRPSCGAHVAVCVLCVCAVRVLPAAGVCARVTHVRGRLPHARLHVVSPNLSSRNRAAGVRRHDQPARMSRDHAADAGARRRRAASAIRARHVSHVRARARANYELFGYFPRMSRAWYSRMFSPVFLSVQILQKRPRTSRSGSFSYLSSAAPKSDLPLTMLERVDLQISRLGFIN